MPAAKRKSTFADERSSKRGTPLPQSPLTPASADLSDGIYIASSDDEEWQEEKQRIGASRKKHDFSNFNKRPSNAKISGVFGAKDFSWMTLKPDHDNRPLYIDANTTPGSNKGPKITLESFSPLAAQATDLLITIAEPTSRPQFMHEYRITEHSLYAALSVGLTGEDIIRGLERLSKTPVPVNVIDYITDHTKSFGKVRLVLRDNRYWMESEDVSIVQKLLQDEVISECRVEGAEVIQGRLQTKNAVIIQGTADARGQAQTGAIPHNRDEQAMEQNILQQTGGLKSDAEKLIAELREEDDEEEEEIFRQTHSFEIRDDARDKVAERCMTLNFPALSEYDFQNDQVNPDCKIDLRPQTQIRPYQEKALSKMFGNGRGKSGLIVLPCGAGKTLVGITAACHIKKSVIVLCTSNMSAHQWSSEFKKWSDIAEEDIAIFSSSEKRQFKHDAGVLVTTYSMLVAASKSQKRAYDTERVFNWVQSREWGLMILDEVHVNPANTFRRVSHYVRAHCKLGLTATLLREDDKIGDLNYLIGPKLFEANWMELAEQGHIARVQCAEVWCPMTMEFYQEYQREKTMKQKLYYTMNPTKFQVCQFLIDYHERRGDKIIVFSDNIFALKEYAIKLNKAYIHGETSNNERIQILENFQHNDLVNTIFLSKIGDTSLDLPEATCLIQISAHYGSRRQEAQRLGRILRAKRRNDEGFNAFFYSLVSKDTSEMAYSAKRQAFLVDQGYAFKTITQLSGMEEMEGLAYKTPEERRELLAHVMLQQESAAQTEVIAGDSWSRNQAGGSSRKKKPVKRIATSLADQSGGGTMAPVYGERSKGQKGPNSEYFKKEARRMQNQKKKNAKEAEERERLKNSQQARTS